MIGVAVDQARPPLRRKAVGQMRPRRQKTAKAVIAQNQIRRMLGVVLSPARRLQLPATQAAGVKARIARRNPLQRSPRQVLIGNEVAAEMTLMMAVSVIRQRSAQVLMKVIAVTKTVPQTEKVPRLQKKGVMKAATTVDAGD